MRSMAQTNCVGQMQVAIKARGDVTGLACEAFMRMFESNEESLVEQVAQSISTSMCVCNLEN